MACCIALAMLIAFARGVWTALIPRRRRPATVDFAPPARREAPGRLPAGRA